MSKLILLSIVAISTACSSSPTHHANIRCSAKYSYPDQTRYDVYPTDTTQEDIEVDSSGLNINLSKIDRLTDEVEKCLYAAFGDHPSLSDDMIKSGECSGSSFELPIHRECLTVKVAADWFPSKYGDPNQLLPYTNGGTCPGKGVPDGLACYYRNGIQDNQTIVVPPSFYLYKDALVRIITGCHNPWYVDTLAVCMTPTTNPLGDGSEP